MLSFLPAFILVPIGFIWFSVNIAIVGSLLFIGGIVKLILPFPLVHKALSPPMHAIFRAWALMNFVGMTLLNKIEWEIKGDEGLNKDSWYLLIANHQSWLDIFVLAYFAKKRIPEPKFFLKESLKRVPFIGMGCWALDMPFMKRYSREFVERNPHLKGKDIETTKKSCERYKDTPTTIINFVEGTRFTPSKHQSQGSQFKHLLTPKAGGIAFTLAAMGQQFDKVLDVTLCYPGNDGHIMLNMLKGKLTKIVISVEQIDVSDNIIGDYFNDDSFKQSFQGWLNETWQSKDEQISQMRN